MSHNRHALIQEDIFADQRVVKHNNNIIICPTCIMIALIPMEIGPLATNQAAISVRQIQKFTTMAKTVQLAYMHKYVPKTQRIYTSNAVKEHYTLSTLVDHVINFL